MSAVPDRIQVLAVDDVPENLVAIDALLKRPDIEVLKASSGTEALEVLLQHDVALALVDVQMPEMDGFELAELMRGSDRTRSVPIIFVTAGAREPTRLFQGYEAGAVDFIFKPIDPHILRSKVDAFVQLEAKRRELAAKVAALESSLRLNDVFTAVLGHDLRSPLSSIVLGTHILLKKFEDEPTRRILERIRTGSDRMSRMISQLLDVARARANGGIRITPIPSNLEELCRTIIAETAGEQGERASLEVQGDPLGRWDADRLGQIVANLVGNALRHGTRGAPVSVLVDGRSVLEVKLKISNEGAIPDEIAAHIFEPFRGKELRASAGEGLGLGLFIVDQLVRAHGGSIEVHSADGRTEFEVVLPREAVGSSWSPTQPASESHR